MRHVSEVDKAYCMIVGAWMGLLLAGSGCGGGSSSPNGERRTNGSGEANAGSGSTSSPGGGLSSKPSGANADMTVIKRSAASGNGAGPIPAGCGNKERGKDEACDDGNTVSGDGCAADCLGVEPGYACPPGKACRMIARCGDGILAVSEACDDGNAKEGDGCSTKCKVELGYACSGDPSKCSKTTCGDGTVEGNEACDDANHFPFDGCSANCQVEPHCEGDACTSKCGDGLVLNEDCDDGNIKDGDGCSSACKVEAGFTCSTETACKNQNGPCVMRVPAIFRDFNESHSDFGVGCGMLVTGIVNERLSPEGKPTLANGQNACIMSADTFAEWYTNNKNNASIAGEIALYDNGKGGFVNRYGANGEQWAGPQIFTNTVFGGNAGEGCMMCTPSATGQCLDPCTAWNSTNQACCSDVTQMNYDGSPLFFPIDKAPEALMDMRYRAKIPEQYGYNGWPWEDMVFPGAPMHNFHFTTEVVYWFKYNPANMAVLDFNGDDDVWVFVNGRLAVDLGGPHVPSPGSVTISAASAGRFALTDGNVYEIRVFHAERKVEGSSFKLTLSGFESGRSECTPICGDGIVTLGEECDDGTNDGGYEECAPGCVLGPSCGDGIMQDGEDCGSSCRNLVLL
jgi:fibro-slime domain-containing protein